MSSPPSSMAKEWFCSAKNFVSMSTHSARWNSHASSEAVARSFHADPIRFGELDNSHQACLRKIALNRYPTKGWRAWMSVISIEAPSFAAKSMKSCFLK